MSDAAAYLVPLLEVGGGHTFAGHFEDRHRPVAAVHAMWRALDFLAESLRT